MPEDELLAIQSQPYSLGLTILNLVAAEWTTVVAYITTGLTKIEWELEHSDYRDEKNGLEAVLDRLHPLRRLLPVYRTMLKDVLNSILHPTNFPRPRNPNSLPSTFEKASHLEKLAADFTSILDRIDRLQVRTQNIISLATTTISIEENQRAMKMNKNLVRVTYLAVVFVPMAFVSSFFSMTPDLGQLTETIWIYFAVSLPLTALCLSVADRRRIVMGFLWINRNSRALFKRKPKRA
jgi:Mg2+ and Co2+ transporter CorA